MTPRDYLYIAQSIKSGFCVKSLGRVIGCLVKVLVSGVGRLLNFRLLDGPVDILLRTYYPMY